MCLPRKMAAIGSLSQLVQPASTASPSWTITTSSPVPVFPGARRVTISLQARASHQEIPGTWGFGLWNDPFGMKLGFGGKHLLPALPNAAWFFFASPPNHLSLRNDLPANGALAATFRSPPIPAWVFTPTILTLPLLLIPS